MKTLVIEHVFVLVSLQEGRVWVCLERINTPTTYLDILTEKLKTKLFFHNLTLTHLLMFHRKSCCLSYNNIWKRIKCKDVKHPKHWARKQTWAADTGVRPLMFHTVPQTLPSPGTLTVPIYHHTGIEEQSLSWENNKRENINKVLSSAIRKRNNEL